MTLLLKDPLAVLDYAIDWGADYLGEDDILTESTRLLRGRSGTQPAIAEHSAGETFCVIEAGSLQSIQLPVTSIGKEVTARTSGSESVSLVVSPRADAIASPSGGATVDAEARTSIAQILATLRQNGLIAT